MNLMATQKQSDEPQGGPSSSRPPLAPEERNLMFLTLMGQTPAEMAAALGQSLADVQAALERLRGRFGVADQRHLIARALLRGWHTPPH